MVNWLLNKFRKSPALDAQTINVARMADERAARSSEIAGKMVDGAPGVVPNYYASLNIDVMQTSEGWVVYHRDWKARTVPMKYAQDAILAMWDYIKTVGDEYMAAAEMLEKLRAARAQMNADSPEDVAA